MIYFSEMRPRNDVGQENLRFNITVIPRKKIKQSVRTALQIFANNRG